MWNASFMCHIPHYSFTWDTCDIPHSNAGIDSDVTCLIHVRHPTWLIHVWHNLFDCVMLLIQMWHAPCMWHASFMCEIAAWLIPIWQNSFYCVIWLNQIWHASCTWHASFTSDIATWLIPMWQNSFSCVTELILMRDKTHSNAWQNSF